MPAAQPEPMSVKVESPVIDETLLERGLMMSKSGRVRAKKQHTRMATYEQLGDNGDDSANASNSLEHYRGNLESKQVYTPSRKRYSDSNPDAKLPSSMSESNEICSMEKESVKVPKFYDKKQQKSVQDMAHSYEKNYSLNADEGKNFSRGSSLNDSKRSFSKTKSFWQPKKSSAEVEEGARTAELTLEDLIKNKAALQAFREFLRSEFSEENLDFWLDCEAYKSLKGTKQMKMAFRIFTEYLSQSAEREVNIDSKIRTRTADRLKNPDKETFVEAQNCIYTLMKTDSFRRFVTSEHFPKASDWNDGFRISLRRVSTKKKFSR